MTDVALPRLSETPTAPPTRSPFAALPVLIAALVLALALSLTAGEYGYHRDELYFRLLEPAWGYLDSPPLTPLLIRWMTELFADEVWALRIPAIVFAVASVPVIALIAREAGGGRFAQGLVAWGYSTGTFTLAFGHTFLTASVDLLVWPTVVLFLMRALLRDQPRWWLMAGVVVGLSLYNKWLIAMLLAAIVVGLLAVGPRRMILSRWAIGGVLLALLIGLPNVIYQLGHGLPQLSMGAALGEGNGAEVRVLMWPLLLVLIGVPLVPFWVAGIVELLRDTRLRAIRSLAVALPSLLLFTLAAGAQIYYPVGLLVCLFAIGCVPVARFAERMPWRRVLVVTAIAVNGFVSGVSSLPLVPVEVLGETPIPSINQATAEQVGWPTYVEQVAAVVSDVSAADPDGEGDPVAIITSNYGEAGALDRFGGPDLAPVYSGHVELWSSGPPPDGTDAYVIVGEVVDRVRDSFESCETVAQLDNLFGVDAEEQGAPISVCTGAVAPWSELWPRFRSLG